MSNLLSIWSPNGEHFEVSKPNFDDLRKHYGWQPQPPETSTAAIATATKVKTGGEEAKPVLAAEPRTGSAVPADGGTAAASESAPADDADGSEADAGRKAGEGSGDSGAEEVTKESLIAALNKFGIDPDKRKSVTGLQELLAEAEAAAAK